jgi:putative copper export protein
MLPDLLSATLRGLAFIAVLQAGGAALFLALFGRSLDHARPRIRKLALNAVLASVLLLTVQYLLEAARMTGELSGLFDASLQGLVLHSTAFTILVLRLFGIALVASSLAHNALGRSVLGIVGAVSIAASFVFTGHTASSPERWILGPVLVLHLLVIEFWFGALLPLIAIARYESAEGAAHLVQRFSYFATILVPMVLVAGIVMTTGLLPNAAALATGYGLALAGKAAVFALLMLLAALNKWRLGPALVAGRSAARNSFITSVKLECTLIVAVLMGTAILTTFWSP